VCIIFKLYLKEKNEKEIKDLKKRNKRFEKEK
jgi:hypothetical protein